MKSIERLVVVMLVFSLLSTIFTGCECKHNRGLTLIEDTATCTSDGITTYTCNQCGETIQEISPARGHDYSILRSSREATCADEGYKQYECSRCRAIKRETLPKLTSHSYDDEHVCTVCGKFDPSYAQLQVPNVPIILNEYDYAGKVEDAFIIEQIDKRVDSTSASLTFTIYKTSDTKGSNYSRSCSFGYKVYDCNNYVIDSGTCYSEAICVGEKTKKSLTVNSLWSRTAPYRLVISPVQ